ncbi:hypothetical protein HDV00_002521 [Rhizophlyctis rosea]|nr:hypothetical protein HDV00_002521 [Rhizophlyctis rosea]
MPNHQMRFAHWTLQDKYKDSMVSLLQHKESANIRLLIGEGKQVIKTHGPPTPSTQSKTQRTPNPIPKLPSSQPSKTPSKPTIQSARIPEYIEMCLPIVTDRVEKFADVEAVLRVTPDVAGVCEVLKKVWEKAKGWNMIKVQRVAVLLRCVKGWCEEQSKEEPEAVRAKQKAEFLDCVLGLFV